MHDDRLDRTTDGSGSSARSYGRGAATTRCRTPGSRPSFRRRARADPGGSAGAACANSASAQISRSRPAGPRRSRPRRVVADAFRRTWRDAAWRSDLELSAGGLAGGARPLRPSCRAVLLFRSGAAGTGRRSRVGLAASTINADQEAAARRRGRDPRPPAIRCSLIRSTTPRAAMLFGWGVTSVFTDVPEHLIAGGRCRDFAQGRFSRGCRESCST